MLLFLVWLLQITPPWPIYSTEADTPFPKVARVKFLFFKQYHDIGRAFPEWAPVGGKDHWVQLEGIVAVTAPPKSECAHVSHEDFPLFHYTHDLTVNVRPFVTPDNRNTNVLANKVLPKKSDAELSKLWRQIYTHQSALRKPRILKKPTKVAYHTSRLAYFRQELSTIWGDTMRSNTIHTEWENGLGAANSSNICSAKNRVGESCGFATAGHQRGDPIWNWPTMGDWVHLEGLWIWDRGHPPAGAELHPLCWMVSRRHHPELIYKPNTQPSPMTVSEIFSRKRSLLQLLAATPHDTRFYADISNQLIETQVEWEKIQRLSTPLWATRIDLFGSGDGGALHNNRSDVPSFVRKVPIHNQNYEFTIPLLKKPQNPQNVVCTFLKQPGNTFTAEPTWKLTGKDSIQIFIPWKTSHQPDTAVFAQTCLCYENHGDTISKSFSEQTPQSFKITIDSLIINKVPDSGKGDLRMYAAIGNQHFMLNEFVPVQNILEDGLGKTSKAQYFIGQTVEIHLYPEDSVWIHTTGWDGDGIDRMFGHLYDSNTKLSKELLRQFKQKILNPFKIGLNGCRDDPMGRINRFFTAKQLMESPKYRIRSKVIPNEDPCPIGNNQQYEGMFELILHIEPVSIDSSKIWGVGIPQ